LVTGNGMVRPCSLSSQRVTLGWGYERSTVMSNKSDSTVATMGIDIGKNSFHVVGLDRRDAIIMIANWRWGFAPSPSRLA
jgi:hypothetical protein